MKKFDYNQVVGHSLICQKLCQAVRTDRVVSAYLFSGSRGIGKKTVASAFTGALLCQSPHEGAPCGVCSSCRLLASGNHPDFIVTRAPADKKNIGIDLIRDQVIKEAYVRPFHSGRKVFLIENSELLTPEAQNALLKILEEPPVYAVFLLLSSASDQLLPPVLSRCLKLQFLPLPNALCHSYFSALSGDAERKELATAFSQGIIGKGLLMLTDDAYHKLYQETIQVLSAVTEKASGLAGVQQFFQQNKERIYDIIDFMLVFLRDCMRVTLSKNPKLICADHKTTIKAYTRTYSTGALIRITEAVINFRKRLLRNANHTAAGLELLTKMQEEMYD